MGLFDPINWQGWPQFGSLGQDFYESQPNAAYQRLLGQMGLISSQSPFGKYAAGQRDDAYNTYLAKLGGMGGTGANPGTYNYTDFLQEWGPQLSSSFENQTPSQRGERFAGGAPRARWIGWPS
jgi:hypothetical protein